MSSPANSRVNFTFRPHQMQFVFASGHRLEGCSSLEAVARHFPPRLINLGNLSYHELQLTVATAETRFGARVLGIEDRNAMYRT